MKSTKTGIYLSIMETLDKIAYLFNYWVESIRNFISTEDLIAEVLITLFVLAFLVVVL